ncbi:hypothetical protein ACTS95_00895 [Empedobacter brevis]
MKRTLLFSLFFILMISIHAQSILISGKIIVDDAKEIIDLNGTTIENLNTHAKTVATTSGLFSIKAHLNDELLVKHNGIQERRLNVSETMLRRGFITIHVNEEIIELAEANIQKLNRDMLKNLGKNKSFQERINDEMGVSSPEFKAQLNLKREEEKVNRTIKQVGGVSVIGLIGLLAKSHKKIKNTIPEKKIKEEQLAALHKFYTTYYFVHDLKIPEGKITEFLDYCYSNFNFSKLLEENNYDEILFILEEQAPRYRSKIKENE